MHPKPSSLARSGSIVARSHCCAHPVADTCTTQLVMEESAQGVSPHVAAQAGDIKQIQRLARGASGLAALSSREGLLGRTAMHVACEHGQVEVVQVS